MAMMGDNQEHYASGGLMSRESRMPTDLGDAHKRIGNELHYLYTKWSWFKRLFCTDDESVRLLMDCSEPFALVSRELMRDDIILGVCRITDRAQSCGRQNLTLDHLAGLIPSQEQALSAELQQLIEEVHSSCAVFRKHRNRRVSHADMKAALQLTNSLLPAIDIAQADEALKAIADVLNAIEDHYDSGEHEYECGILNWKEAAEELLHFIAHEQYLQRYHDKRKFGSE